MSTWVVAVGTPWDGVRLFGPFAFSADAEAWAEPWDEPWEVVELQPLENA